MAKYNSSAQAIAVDTIIKIIIGITIFALGLFLFSQIFTSSKDSTQDLTQNLKNDLGRLQCQGDEIICTSSITMNSGKEKSSQVFITNKEDLTKSYKIKINNLDSDNLLTKPECGSLVISYYKSIINVKSGTSSSLPIVVKSSRILKKPCSFITSVSLIEEDVEISKTNLIINIE